jgi:hypothetical protein
MVEVDLKRLVLVHETTDALKDQLKTWNKEYKTMKEEMEETVTKHPGQKLQISEHFMLEIKSKKRLPGMNTTLLAEAYVAYQTYLKRNVTEKERDEFLLFIKNMRKERTETVQEVLCSPVPMS